jgi:hypothetical protein
MKSLKIFLLENTNISESEANFLVFLTNQFNLSEKTTSNIIYHYVSVNSLLFVLKTGSLEAHMSFGISFSMNPAIMDRFGPIRLSFDKQKIEANKYKFKQVKDWSNTEEGRASVSKQQAIEDSKIEQEIRLKSETLPIKNKDYFLQVDVLKTFIKSSVYDYHKKEIQELLKLYPNVKFNIVEKFIPYGKTFKGKFTKVKYKLPAALTLKIPFDKQNNSLDVPEKFLQVLPNKNEIIKLDKPTLTNLKQLRNLLTKGITKFLTSLDVQEGNFDLVGGIGDDSMFREFNGMLINVRDNTNYISVPGKEDKIVVEKPPSKAIKFLLHLGFKPDDNTSY